VEIEIDRPLEPIRLGLDSDLAERILQPVVETPATTGARRSACRSSTPPTGSSTRWSTTTGRAWRNERERIFEPGVRGTQAPESGGAGLGLALARRVGRSADGDVEAVTGNGGGRFVIRLPAG